MASSGRSSAKWMAEAGMHILYFYQYFTTPKGAYSTRVYELARRWVAQGARVTVVTACYDKSDLRSDKLFDRRTIEGIELRIINIATSNKQSFLRRILGFVAFSMASVYYAVTIRANILVCSSGPLFVGLPGLAAKFLRGTRYIFEVRDIWPEGAIQLGVLRNPVLKGLARWFEGVCYRHAAGIIPLSPGMKEWIEGRCPYKPMRVIPNASDLQLASEAEPMKREAEGLRYVTFSGSLGMLHDPWMAVRVAEELKRRDRDDIRVIICGDGKDRSAMQEHAETNRLDNLRLLGNCPKLEVFSWLKISDCALFYCNPAPIIDTASPNKVFDYLATGVPVVQTTQGWIKDLLSEHGCGLTVARSDAVAICGAIEKLVDDRALREEMSRCALRVAENHFDRDRLAAEMLEFIRSVCGTSGTMGSNRGA